MTKFAEAVAWCVVIGLLGTLLGSLLTDAQSRTTNELHVMRMETAARLDQLVQQTKLMTPPVWAAPLRFNRAFEQFSRRKSCSFRFLRRAAPSPKQL